VYIVLNKPVGVTCTAAEEVKDNIISYMNYDQYIFPVGRLDKESQGLIIMTNDGVLANKILESDNLHEKEYVVTVDKDFDNDFIRKMADGVDIGDVITRPCKVEKINNNTFKIILTQGLNKQIRRMTKAFGYTVIKLERIRIMNIKLDDIEYGTWRNITEEELKVLKEESGL
ncbi:MAG: pseudouridine synthase, partial [Clostridium saudiense]|nr:pseudouridine synthase [Clostridium saudiense]